MTAIANISNAEVGLSVRNALNDAIDRLNAIGINAAGGLAFSGTKSFSGANSADNSWVWMDTGSVITGNANSPSPTGATAPIQFFVNDNVNTNSGDGELSFLSVTLAPAIHYTGNRNAIRGYVTVVGAPDTGSPTDNTNAVGVLGLGHAGANMGGTAGGSITAYRGQVFGGNFNAFSDVAATALAELCGAEVNVQAAAATNPARKIALSLVNGAADADSGDFEDALLQLASQDGAIAMQNGIMFGGYSVQFPHDTNSTLIGAVARVAPSAGSPAAMWGVDFNAVTFNASGGFLRGPGFLVGPTGSLLVTPAASATPPSNGNLVIERTSNTTLTFKLKGTDGTVRSGTITLA